MIKISLDNCYVVHGFAFKNMTNNQTLKLLADVPIAENKPTNPRMTLTREQQEELIRFLEDSLNNIDKENNAK